MLGIFSSKLQRCLTVLKMNSFPEEIHSALKFYVYRLIDPRNGQTFYVGKGQGDRVFQHGYESENSKQDSQKLSTIRSIRSEGLEPLYIIHRHGMTEPQALLAEAVLIDAYPGLSNEVSGHGSFDNGPANIAQIVVRYKAAEMNIPSATKIMAINIRLSHSGSDSIYQAVRCAWKVSRSRAERADIVLAMIQGICRGVYRPTAWLQATKENFPHLVESQPDRFGFEGKAASRADERNFLAKKLPPEMQRRKGMASPVLYNYK